MNPENKQELDAIAALQEDLDEPVPEHATDSAASEEPVPEQTQDQGNAGNNLKEDVPLLPVEGSNNKNDKPLNKKKLRSIVLWGFMAVLLLGFVTANMLNSRTDKAPVATPVTADNDSPTDAQSEDVDQASSIPETAEPAVDESTVAAEQINEVLPVTDPVAPSLSLVASKPTPKVLDPVKQADNAENAVETSNVVSALTKQIDNSNLRIDSIAQEISTLSRQQSMSQDQFDAISNQLKELSLQLAVLQQQQQTLSESNDPAWLDSNTPPPSPKPSLYLMSSVVPDCAGCTAIATFQDQSGAVHRVSNGDSYLSYRVHLQADRMTLKNNLYQFTYYFNQNGSS